MKMIKKIVCLFLLTATISTFAQESVLLRLKHKKGDKYVVNLEQITSMGLQGGLNMKMQTDMIVSESNGTTFKTESKIKFVVLDMLQGGQNLNYDSRKNSEDLDEGGRAMKTQFDPILKSIVYSTLDKSGKIIETKIEPSIPGAEQLIGSQPSIDYPEEKVSVGSTWTTEDDVEGAKTTTVYKVSKIANGTVYLTISGTVSGLGKGTVEGKAEIDIKTGIQKRSEMSVSISSEIIEVKVTSKISIDKV